MVNSRQPGEIEPDGSPREQQGRGHRGRGIKRWTRRRIRSIERAVQRAGGRTGDRLKRGVGRLNARMLIIMSLVAGLLGVGFLGGHFLRKRRAADRALIAGEAALEAGNWEEACRHLQVYLFKYPNDVEVLVQYAEANLSVRPLRSANIGSAVGAYLRGLKIKPGDAEISDRLGRLYFSLKDYPQVVEVCRRRLSVAPDDARATVWLGRSLVAEADREGGTELLTRFVEKHPAAVEVYGLLSELALEEGSQSSIEAALAWLDLGVSSNPKSAEARVRRARFYRRVMGDVEAARTDLRVAGVLEPADLKTRLLLAEGWLDLGELDRAEEELEAIKQLGREALAGQDVNLENLSLALFRAEANLVLRRVDKDKGVELAGRGLEELTGGRRVMFLPLAVDLYLASGRIEEARACVDEYQDAIEGRPEADASVSNQLALLGAALASAEDRSYGVINLLEHLVVSSPVGEPIPITPANVQIWKLLAQAYDHTGQPGRSLAALEKYVLRQPGDWEATLALAKAYYRNGDLPRAQRYARTAQRLKPGDLETELLHIKASLRYVAKRAPELAASPSREALAALREAHPENVEIRLLQATIAVGQGRHADAVAELERAIKECDEPLPASLQLARLYCHLGRDARGIEVCEAAVQRHDGVAAPWIALAGFQSSMGRVDQAGATLEQALAKLEGPELASAKFALVRHLLSRKRRGKAIDELRQLAADQADDVRSRLALLDFPEVQEDREACQRLVDELQAIEGRRGLRWRFQQACVWLRDDGWKDQQERIAEMLMYCIHVDPSWSSPVLALGWMYESLGRDDRAEDTYRRFIRAYRHEASVVAQLAELLERQGRFTEAAQMVDRVPAGLAALGDHRAIVAMSRGDYDAAIEELERQGDTRPRSEIPRVLLARLIYQRTGKAELALRLLEEIRASRPDLVPAVAARVAILHAEGRNEEAVATLDAEVARRNDFAACLLRADYYADSDQFDLAEKDYMHLTALGASTAEAHIALGRFYQRFGRTDQAIDAWETGLEADPDNVELQRLWVRAAVFSAHTDVSARGREMLGELLERDPNDAELLSIHADVLLKDGSADATEAAKTVLEKVIELAPRNAAAHLRLVRLARERGELRSASRLAVRALGANPQNVEFLLIRAELEKELDNALAARELARSVLDIDPKNVTARNLLANLALGAGDIESAEELTDAALKVDAASEEVQLLRARILNAKGQRAEAIRHLESYRQAEGGRHTPATLLALADFYRMQGRFSEAEAIIEEAQQRDADSLRVRLIRMRLLATQQRFAEILELVSARPEMPPEDGQIFLSVASILASAGAREHMRQAKPLFEHFVAANPDRAEGYLGLGLIEYQLGEVYEAARAYRRLLELAPYHQQGLNHLAWILAEELRRPEEALELANRGVLRHLDDPRLLNTRGVVFLRLNRLPEAAQDLEKCLEMTANLPSTRAQTLLYLGRIYIKQGDEPLARAKLKEALQVDRQYKVLTSDERAEIERLINHSS